LVHNMQTSREHLCRSGEAPSLKLARVFSGAQIAPPPGRWNTCLHSALLLLPSGPGGASQGPAAGWTRCVPGPARPVPWLAETYLADRGVVEQVRIWRAQQGAVRNQDRAVGVRTPSLRKAADTWLSTARPGRTRRVAI
jgi:hypothetical protein